MNENKTIEQGRLSEVILNDETFRNAILKTEEGIVQKWKQATTLEEREDCHYQLKALTSLLIELKIPVMLKHQLQQKQKEEN